jgi:hypothetical protein
MRWRLVRNFLAIACVFAPSPMLAQGREIPRRPPRVPRAIILPPQVIAREQATLAVIDGTGRLLPGVVVELSGEQKITTDATGRAVFIAPSTSGRLVARIPGTEISASSVAVGNERSAPSTGSAEGNPVVKITWYPHVMAVHDRFAIAGKGFRSAAGLNQVFLADRQCLVIAASSVSLVVLPGPHIPVGTTILSVNVDGRETVSVPVTAVMLDVNGPLEAPNAGAPGKLIIRVHGTTEPVPVEVRNASTQIIQLLHGNIQSLVTSGGEENIAPVEVKFLAPGDYTITARLVPVRSATSPVRN